MSASRRRRNRLVVDLGPSLVVGGPAEGLAVPLVLALAVDAGVGIRQGVEPGLGDLAAAELAAPVDPLDDPLEGVLDLAEFAALDLDDLRADLVIGGIDRGVNAVADDVHGGEFAIGVEVAVEGFAERIAAGDQPRVESEQGIFAGQFTPPGVLRGRSTVAVGDRGPHGQTNNRGLPDRG